MKSFNCYPRDGVYESSSEGFHLKSLSILLGKETVLGFSKARTVRRLFVILKLFYALEEVRKQLLRAPFKICFFLFGKEKEFEVAKTQLV